MKLGTLLLRDAVISLGQLEAGLKAQVLYGGRLGTNLVELGYLAVDALGLYLSKIHAVPAATQDDFHGADREVIKEFGAELAELYDAFPLGYERGAENTLAVAMLNPRDEDAIAELARQCECRIRPYAAAELRILYYLERHYDLPRKARFLRSASSRDAAVERRRTQPAGGLELPGVVRFEPKKRQRLERAPEGKSSPRLSYLDACNAIDGAEHRDLIGEALVEYAVGRFGAGAALMVRQANAVGWRAYSSRRPDAQGAIETLSLPLEGTSVLQAAHDSARPYRGPAMSAGRPVERRLWEALGVGEPVQMLVVPVLVRKRVVNLLYAHGEEALDEQHTDEIIELAIRASAAYVRLIQAAKSS